LSSVWRREGGIRRMGGGFMNCLTVTYLVKDSLLLNDFVGTNDGEELFSATAAGAEVVIAGGTVAPASTTSGATSSTVS
jgi:hypothetical protein